MSSSVACMETQGWGGAEEKAAVYPDKGLTFTSCDCSPTGSSCSRTIKSDWESHKEGYCLLPLCGFQRQQGPHADCHKPPREAFSPALTASSFPSAPVWIPGLLPHPPLAQCQLRLAGPARNDGPWCGTSPALQWHWKALQTCLLPQPPRNQTGCFTNIWVMMLKKSTPSP